MYPGKTLQHVKQAYLTQLNLSMAFSYFYSGTLYHRHNGSSSPVLTATSLSYAEAKNSTPHRIKTPDPIEIKFGTGDYVGEMTPLAKLYANHSKGGFSANR